MAKQLDNLWSVAGLPGSGKTSMSVALEQTGDFLRVDRDDYLERFNNQLGPQRLVEIMRLCEIGLNAEFERAAEEYVRIFQVELAFYIAWVETMRSPFAPPILNFSRRLVGMDFLQLLDVFMSDSSMVADYVSFFANCRSVSDAVEQAKITDKTVLFENPELLFRQPRDAARIYFRQNGVMPSLLILRSTRDHIMRVAGSEERRAMGFLDLVSEEVLRHDPYDTAEDWDRVVALKAPLEVEGISDTVRSRISSLGLQNITGSVSFLRKS